MWKSIALCASLFGGAAVGLATAARWVEPGAWAVAIGLCVIGVVLIRAAPAIGSPEPELKTLDVTPVDPTRITDELPTI
jgi:hypothetical protein